MVSATTDTVEQKFTPSQQVIRAAYPGVAEVSAYVRGFQSQWGLVILLADSHVLERQLWGGSVTSDAVHIVRRDITEPKIEGPLDVVEHKSRTIEMNWLSRQRDLLKKLAGQWIALDGERLVANGQKLTQVLERSRSVGVPNPFVICLPEAGEEDVAIIA